jgi:hypothetical protein
MHSYLYEEQMEKGLIYWPNHSGESQLAKQEVQDCFNPILHVPLHLPVMGSLCGFKFEIKITESECLH